MNTSYILDNFNSVVVFLFFLPFLVLFPMWMLVMQTDLGIQLQNQRNQEIKREKERKRGEREREKT